MNSLIAFVIFSPALDLCMSEPCQNNGTCLQRLDRTVMCMCARSYYGDYCELQRTPTPPQQDSINTTTMILVILVVVVGVIIVAICIISCIMCERKKDSDDDGKKKTSALTTTTTTASSTALVPSTHTELSSDNGSMGTSSAPQWYPSYAQYTGYQYTGNGYGGNQFAPVAQPTAMVAAAQPNQAATVFYVQP